MDSPLKKVHQVVWGLVVFGLAEAGCTMPGVAQIFPDGTLSTNSTVTPFSTCVPSCTINGGTVRGTTLFHSFSQFSVPAGGEAYFNNAAGIQNIFARVTGLGNLSIINGGIRTNGTANLFLLNPNGISFGPGASLSINGSFLATTATRVVFPNGSLFSADNPQDAPLLTVVAPIGLQYGGMGFTPAPLILNSGNLVAGQDLNLSSQSLSSAEIGNSGSLTAGRDLTLTSGTNSSNIIRNSGSLTAGRILGLSAGALDLQGQLRAGSTLGLLAQNTITIRDTTTNSFQAVAGDSLSISNGLATGTIDISALSNPSSGFAAGGDLTLRSSTSIRPDAHYWAGGNFQVQKLDGSPGNLSGSGASVVLANGNVTIGNYDGPSLHLLAGGSIAANALSLVPITSSNGINPNSSTFSPLSSVPLPDGQVLTIDSSTTPTLDLRAGIDWAARGGFPFLSTLTLPNGALPTPIALPSSTRADLIFNGDPNSALTSGLVLLSNRFSPSAAAGSITVQGSQITAFSNTTSAGRTIVFDPRTTTIPVVPLVVPVPPIAPSNPPPSNPGDLRDPSVVPQETLWLSLNLVDSTDPKEEQIAERCGVFDSSGFVITGRGGLPPSASNTQNSGALPIPWVSRGGSERGRATALTVPASPAPIVEAQGIAIASNGEVWLTATASATPYGSRSPFVACPQARN